MIPYKVELEEGELDPGGQGRGRWLGEPRDREKPLRSVAGGWYERRSISMTADIIDESWEWWICGCRDEAPWKSQGFTVNGFSG